MNKNYKELIIKRKNALEKQELEKAKKIDKKLRLLNK